MKNGLKVNNLTGFFFNIAKNKDRFCLSNNCCKNYFFKEIKIYKRQEMYFKIENILQTAKKIDKFLIFTYFFKSSAHLI
jgi:hypothetical protein